MINAFRHFLKALCSVSHKPSVSVKKMGFMAALLLPSMMAQAAPIYQMSGGFLTGIQNIDINGDHYDVEFLDGEIESLYDLEESFFFNTPSQAADATFALQNVIQDVVAGNFDTDPLLISGCAGDNCYIHVPYLFDFGFVSTQWFRNASNELDDERGGVDLDPNYNSVGNAVVMTRWHSSAASVSEPGSAILMMAGLAFFLRKRGCR